MYSAVLDAATIPVIGYVLGDTRCCGRGMMAMGFSLPEFVNWQLRPLSGSYVYPLEVCPACSVLGRACPAKAVFGGVPRLEGAYCHWWHGWGRLPGTRCRRQGPRGGRRCCWHLSRLAQPSRRFPGRRSLRAIRRSIMEHALLHERSLASVRIRVCLFASSQARGPLV